MNETQRGISFTPCAMLPMVIAVQNDTFLKYKALAVVLKIGYAVVIVFGVLGNLLVIAAVVRSPRLRNVRNYFILNLACSDLLLCTATAPVTLYSTLNLFWPFGDALCRAVASLQAVNTFVSSLTLASIALDRYLLVICPLRSRRRGPRTVVCTSLLFVWSFALAVALPYSFAVSDAPTRWFPPWNANWSDALLLRCQLRRPHMCVELFWRRLPVGRNTYTVAVLVLQYSFPLLALIFVYTNIASRMRQRLLSSAANEDRRRAAAERNRNAAYLLTALVMVFGLCWLPVNLYHCLDMLQVIDFNQKVYIFCHLVGMTSACANPVLYGALNDNFRRVFWDMAISIKAALTTAARLPASLLLSGGNDGPQPSDPPVVQAAAAETPPPVDALVLANALTSVSDNSDDEHECIEIANTGGLYSIVAKYDFLTPQSFV